jgi:predicted enzyme related to lactoylglutathione lyase
MPRKDGYIVMLNQQEGIKPNPNGKHHATDAYFWCQEIDEYYSSIKKKGGLKILEIEERPLYGMREFEVYDPDGYKLVFAEDMKRN